MLTESPRDHRHPCTNPSHQAKQLFEPIHNIEAPHTFCMPGWSIRLARARRLAGFTGYLTNLPADVMPAAEVIASYHLLWHFADSFRISKSDLAARPVFHHERDAIEAPPTVAMTVTRHLQNSTGSASA